MPNKQQVEININVPVKLFLTDYGKEIYKKHYENLNCLKYMPNLDEEIKIGLWEISNIFGKVLYMGNPQIPFIDNKIKIDFKINEDKKIKVCL